MKTIKSIVALALCSLLVQTAKTQEIVEQLPWQQRDRKDIKPLEYQYQREADVFWSKNIWRVIDVRQKMNKPFAYPQRPLIQIIHEAAMRGDFKVYDPSVVNADQFKKEMTVAEVARIGVKHDTTLMPNPENPETEDVVVINQDLTWDKITKFRVHEVWFFDTRTSSMQVRIVGIAPVMEYYDGNGTYMGDMVMYWIPFASLRGMLATQEVFNRQNDSQHYSWDDLFAMRMFESTIYKENNVYDKNINEYASGKDILLENDRIKQKIFETDHDLWEY